MPLISGGGMVSIPVEAHYHTFILRCWQESVGDQDEEPVWRFCLTQVKQKHEKLGFADLEALTSYLIRVLKIKVNKGVS